MVSIPPSRNVHESWLQINLTIRRHFLRLICISCRWQWSSCWVWIRIWCIDFFILRTTFVSVRHGPTKHQLPHHRIHRTPSAVSHWAEAGRAPVFFCCCCCCCFNNEGIIVGCWSEPTIIYVFRRSGSCLLSGGKTLMAQRTTHHPHHYSIAHRKFLSGLRIRCKVGLYTLHRKFLTICNVRFTETYISRPNGICIATVTQGYKFCMF